MRDENKEILRDIGRELKVREPGAVKRTRKKKGAEAARKQKTAILLSKARKAGVGIPSKRKRALK